jgi:hypothetical protein
MSDGSNPLDGFRRLALNFQAGHGFFLVHLHCAKAIRSKAGEIRIGGGDGVRVRPA